MANKDQFKVSKLPIAKNEDVEFSAELADQDDKEAQARADQADARQQSKS